MYRIISSVAADSISVGLAQYAKDGDLSRLMDIARLLRKGEFFLTESGVVGYYYRDRCAITKIDRLRRAGSLGNGLHIESFRFKLLHEIEALISGVTESMVA